MKIGIWFLLLGVLAITSAVMWIASPSTSSNTAITNFDECVAAGNPVAESYPATCRANGKVFTQNIGNANELSDSIVVDVPQVNATVSSPLFVTGKARGPWFFEGEFPVEIQDSNGLTLANGKAMASGEWTTTEFVDFSATLRFSAPQNSTGTLILTQSDPRGDGEVLQLKVPVKY